MGVAILAWLLATVTALGSGANLLLVVPCHGGHFSAMIGTAKALESGGHNLTFYLNAKCKDMVTERFPNVRTIENDFMQSEWSVVDPGVWEFILKFEGMISRDQDKVYQGMDTFLQWHRKDFDLAIIDSVYIANVQAAEKHDLSLVINLSGESGPVPRWNEQFYPILGKIKTFAMFFGLSFMTSNWKRQIIERRADIGLPPLPFDLYLPFEYTWKQFPIIIHGAPPILPELPASVAHAHVGAPRRLEDFPPISDQMRLWMDQSETPIVYINLGTHTRLDNDAVAEFIPLLEGQNELRVIWATSSVNIDYFRTVAKQSGKLLYGPYLPQVAILADERVVVNVMHGGQNSFFDSLSLRKPFVCIPGFADQPINCGRGEVLGIGKTLHSFEAAPLMREIQYVMENRDGYIDNLERIAEEFLQYDYSNATYLVDRVLRENIRHIELDYNPTTLDFRLGYYVVPAVFVAKFSLLITLFVKHVCCRKSKSKTQ